MNLIKLILLIIVLLHSSLLAQTDSLPKYTLENIIITADKIESNLLLSTGAVSSISANELKTFALHDLAKSLALVPGVDFYRSDGIGNTIATCRGFYGGGEADYLLLMLDGQLLNQFESGLIDWNVVPLSAIESIEFVKGGVSSVHGDAAIGGVINLRTKKSVTGKTSVRATLGSYNYFDGQFSTFGRLNDGNYNIYLYRNQYEGFRKHSNHLTHTFGIVIPALKTETVSITASTVNNWQNEDKPGVLTGEQTYLNRNYSSPFFKNDNRNSRVNRGDIAIHYQPSNSMELQLNAGAEYNKVDDVTTFLLSPIFADTKDREYQSTNYTGNMLANYKITSLFNSEFLFGVTLSYGKLTNAYYNVFMGDKDSYNNSDAERGMLDESGFGNRKTAAVYTQLDISPFNNLKISIGGRYDEMNDTYSDLTNSVPKLYSNSKNAFSPKAGINFHYANTENLIGSIYASVSRSFKAPTMDQLFDQRSYPVPFEPYKILLSNNLLQPQKALNVEAGLYEGFTIGNYVSIEISTSVYQIKMKDEIDFDLSQFKYVNIGESTHRGIEAGLKLFYSNFISSFANYSYQQAVVANGINDGKKLKGIPSNTFTAGIAVNPDINISGSVMLKRTGGIFIDDENFIELPDYTVFDASVTYSFYPFGLTLSSENVFDKKYNANGYADPSGTPGLIYYYPAAGRRINFSVEINI